MLSTCHKGREEWWITGQIKTESFLSTSLEEYSFSIWAFLILLLTYAVQIFSTSGEKLPAWASFRTWCKVWVGSRGAAFLEAVQEQVHCYWNKHEMNCAHSAVCHISYILPPAQLLILEPLLFRIFTGPTFSFQTALVPLWPLLI